MRKEKCAAIVLSAGKGKRMGLDVPKQYIEVKGKPILAYSLQTFEESEIIDEIVIVAGKEDIEFCKKEIVDKYFISKVTKIVEGGKERYDSVYAGLNSVKDTDYVFIHDGARPMLEVTTIKKAFDEVKQSKACVIGVPAKDTIKVADEIGYCDYTPPRSKTWIVQTPQVFEYSIILEAYDRALKDKVAQITDDAMVVENYSDTKIKFVEGSYENIKITTLSDLVFMEALLEHIEK